MYERKKKEKINSNMEESLNIIFTQQIVLSSRDTRIFRTRSKCSVKKNATDRRQSKHGIYFWIVSYGFYIPHVLVKNRVDIKILTVNSSRSGQYVLDEILERQAYSFTAITGGET